MVNDVWRGRGRWILSIISILLITVTVFIGKDYSYACEDFVTPTCKNGEYKRRMWSNKTFIWFLLLSIGFMIITGSFFYFSGVSGVAIPTTSNI